MEDKDIHGRKGGNESSSDRVRRQADFPPVLHLPVAAAASKTVPMALAWPGTEY